MATLGEEMGGMAGNAVRDAKNLFGAELDYTEATLPALDAVLVNLRSAAAGLDEKQAPLLRNMAALKFGAYLGEVVRRECGGVWVKDVPGAPENMPVVSLGREYALSLPVVLSLLEGRSVPLQGREVRSTAGYFAVVAERQRAWLEEMLLGTAPDRAALRAALSADPALADELIVQLELALLTAAAKWGLLLDFQEPSVEGLDALLGELHAAFRDAPPSTRATDEQLRTMATLWGVYLGEVIRRHHGGLWVASEMAGQGAVLRLEMGGVVLFPLSKVLKRIRVGADEAIDVYYRATRSLLREKGIRKES